MSSVAFRCLVIRMLLAENNKKNRLKLAYTIKKVLHSLIIQEVSLNINWALLGQMPQLAAPRVIVQ